MLAPATDEFIDPRDAAGLLLLAGNCSAVGRMCRVGKPSQSDAMTTTTELTRELPPQPVQAETLEYHRLARGTERYRWWKPLMVGLVSTVFYVGLVALAIILVAIMGLATPALWEPIEQFFADPALDMRDPGTFTVGMISVALMLPAVLAAIRVVLGAKPMGLVSSVAGRIRWGWLLHCLGIAVVLYGAVIIGETAVQAVRGESLAPAFVNTQALPFLVLVLLLVPFQAAAEEYVFRGYFMQWLGAWFRHPALAIVLPVPLFTLGHQYELSGMIDVAFFAIVAGWLTWRTGGLEAAIAVHVVNNVGVFTLGAFGFVDLNATSSTTIDLVISLLLTAIFAIVAVKAADRMGIQRTRSVTS